MTVMLVTSFCWWLYDGDWFEMLVAEPLCWRLFSWCWWFSQCIKSVTNTFGLQHPSPTSMQPFSILSTRWLYRTTISYQGWVSRLLAQTCQIWAQVLYEKLRYYLWFIFDRYLSCLLHSFSFLLMFFILFRKQKSVFDALI